MNFLRTLRTTAVVLCSALAMSTAGAETLSGFVIHVSDGDTVTALLPNKESIRIRMAGIDAPESKQDFGRRSRQLMSRLVKNRDVQIHVVDRDKYGRYVARLETSDGDVGIVMLEQGLARVYLKYVRNLSRDYQAAYMHAESQARSEGLGLWSDPRQIPPWEWRQQQRSKSGW